MSDFQTFVYSKTRKPAKKASPQFFFGVLRQVSDVGVVCGVVVFVVRGGNGEHASGSGIRWIGGARQVG